MGGSPLNDNIVGRVRVTRAVDIPDRTKFSRFAKAPELGPRILMFSGGSALHSLCRQLKTYTHNSIHLITPFDSGGSSAALRQAFAMPAVGDLRQRLIALADETVLGNPEVYRLFDHRLACENDNDTLRYELTSMASGAHPFILDIPANKRSVIEGRLRSLLLKLPDDFDLRGASVGNLILTGGYLDGDYDLEGTLNLFSELVSARGIVRPVVSDTAHLFAQLEDGRVLSGQHELTGKEVSPIDSPVSRVLLSANAHRLVPAQVALGESNRALIKSAELICFGPGSFYSSLVANLLPKGVGRAVAANEGPKIFIPNLGIDPEQYGMNFERLLTVLLSYMMQDDGDIVPADVLNYVLVDRSHGVYPSPIDEGLLRNLGVELIDIPLVTPQSAPYYDDNKLLQTLLSLV